MTISETRKVVETALMAIVDLTDEDSWEEQCDCIMPLRRLRDKLKEKEITHK